MEWLRERPWQQTIAINVVILGAILIYLGMAGGEELGPVAWTGIVFMAIGIGAPLVSQLVHAYRDGEEEVEV